ncbi:MAG: diaminopimelate decarboxylase [Bacteroidales bacterium]|nr:diaminopimelate decarboxylase [Bacteroidales bacterium]MBP5134889.1 diaminopimelate decarboxylase [Paludibacteraceae bacterium]MBR6311029.1 diaminopimelate decarboxylase [Paludibacteraceae bacterium]MDD6358014.1 diaminopimelate decarboxylase [Bacteroidales bacterium]
MKGVFPVARFEDKETPFYYYDVELLEKTLDTIKTESGKYGFKVHYAVKANANKRILQLISQSGLGADCVSGNEVKACVEAGFPAEKIVFAGVGKTDKEINEALDCNIFCFNVESRQEMDVINELAAAKSVKAQIAIRVNPNVDAHTHAKITTGLNENKFGINLEMLPDTIRHAQTLEHVELIGLHFHIGSQITDMSAFEDLCVRINELQDELEQKLNLVVPNINVGGGLGVNYEHPNHLPIADFETYFRVFSKYLKLRAGQTLHCEPGRSVVAQCGSLITRVTYLKEGTVKKFLIVDAGMTDLIRPAMYDSYHRIENLTSDEAEETYDVVGPICESSDVFGKDRVLNKSKRGDVLAIRSAGAYGEIMSSRYNLRALPKAYFSDDF